jgi:hypothetical protein
MPQGRPEYTPLSNSAWNYPNWVSEYMALCEYIGHGDLVARHKELLGKQAYTFQGFKRYWVWENLEERWRVYVSNTKGIGVEVICAKDHRTPSEQDALAAWTAYRKAVGCPV